MSIQIEPEDYAALLEIFRRLKRANLFHLREFLADRSDCRVCGMPKGHSVHVPLEQCSGCIAPEHHHTFEPSFP